MIKARVFFMIIASLYQWISTGRVWVKDARMSREKPDQGILPGEGFRLTRGCLKHQKSKAKNSR